MNKCNSQITLFDTMVTSDRLQEIKIVLPYLPPTIQRFVGLYSKVEELRNTVSLFNDEQNIQEFSARDKAPESIIEELKDYLTDAQMESIENLSNLRSMMEMLKDIDIPEESGVDMESIFEMMNMKGKNFNE